MKIEHILPASGRIPVDSINGPRSGIVQAALTFARCFAARKHQVGFTGWSEGRPRTHISPEGVRIRTHPGFPIGQFYNKDIRWFAPMALRSYTANRPDVLHIHADPQLLWLRGRVKVLHLHTPVPDAGSPAYIRHLSNAAAVICCSQFLRTRFLSISRWDAERTFVVHNGTDLDRLRPATADERARARTKFGIDQNAFIVMYAGAIVPEKGLIHLVRAFERLKQRIERAVLLVAGGSTLWGGIGATLEPRIKYEQTVQSEMSTNAHMLGKLPHSEMPYLFQAADVLVMPSVWEEPLGLVALDGLAAGLPEVVSNVGGLPEIVDDGRTGILVPPGDELALEQAMYELATNQDFRIRLGNAARERAQQFAWDNMVDQLEHIYETLLATHT